MRKRRFDASLICYGPVRAGKRFAWELSMANTLGIKPPSWCKVIYDDGQALMLASSLESLNTLRGVPVLLNDEPAGYVLHRLLPLDEKSTSSLTQVHTNKERG